MRAAFRAADAETLVVRALGRDIGPDTPVWLVAAGKAAPAMARGALGVVGLQVLGGVVIGPSQETVPGLQSIMGEHPQPGLGSEAAGQRALEIARGVPPDGQLLVLLSGGASALMAGPVPEVPLSEKKAATATLLRAGADIHSLNTVRKHLSAIKGGWLAAHSRAACRTLAVSDVVGDDLSVIASGPTVADPSTFAEAFDVVRRLGGVAAYPHAVVAHLAAGMRGERPETPKPGDPRLARSLATVIGGRADAMRGAEEQARARGYRVIVIDAPVVGDARVAGRRHAEHVLRVLAPDRHAAGPLCVVSSGETTVTVRGHGRGGRNQEFALAAAEVLAASGRTAILASAGTDGVDGPTDAAGAIADATTLARAHAAGLAPVEFHLDNNDSYTFFAGTDDLILTGPTGTNVGDLQVMLVT